MKSLVNNKLGKSGGKRPWLDLRYYSGICLEGPRKITIILIHVSHLNQGPPGFRAGMLSARPWHSMHAGNVSALSRSVWNFIPQCLCRPMLPDHNFLLQEDYVLICWKVFSWVTHFWRAQAYSAKNLLKICHSWWIPVGRIFISCKVRTKGVLGRNILILPLIWHGPHRKPRVQQFFHCCVFVATVTVLLSHWLATTRGYV
jgi:hypothetical protein